MKLGPFKLKIIKCTHCGSEQPFETTPGIVRCAKCLTFLYEITERKDPPDKPRCKPV